jgi:hypothetical protein
MHTALIIDSDEALHQRLVPAPDRALRAREPVLIVVSPHTQQVVRSALGERAEQLHGGIRGRFINGWALPTKPFAATCNSSTQVASGSTSSPKPIFALVVPGYRSIGSLPTCRMRRCATMLMPPMAVRSPASGTADATPPWSSKAPAVCIVTSWRRPARS